MRNPSRAPGARLLSAAVFTALLVTAEAALGQPVDPKTRFAARKLGTEALKLYDAGDWGPALEKFNLADQLVPAPTLGLRAARCLAKLGRLVEASERYLEVTRMPLDRSALAVHRRAQADALSEREKLLPTIPTLQIDVPGPLEGVSVLLDGKPVPPALVGQRQPVDPGTHKVVARRGDLAVTREAILALGGSGTVVLPLPEAPAAPKTALPEPRNPRRTVANVAIVTGGVGLVVGVVNGVMALTTQSSLLVKCGPSRDCPPSAWGQAGSYDAMRASTTVGFVVGGLGLAVGVPLLLTSSSGAEPGRPDAPARAELTPWIGPFGGGLRGRF